MSTKHIIATLNVILALQIRFSTQLNHNQSDTYQPEWSIETNLLDFDDDSNEQLLAFSEFSSYLRCREDLLLLLLWTCGGVR